MASDPRQAAIEDTFRSIGHVMAWLQGCIRTRFSAEGVTMGQMGILRVLKVRGSATPKELADTLQVTTGDVTGLLDKLEAAGLVTRRRSTEDRRVVHIEPTAKAKARFDQLRTASIELLTEAFEGWTVREIRELQRYLSKLTVGRPRPSVLMALEKPDASAPGRPLARGAVRARR